MQISSSESKTLQLVAGILLNRILQDPYNCLSCLLDIKSLPYGECFHLLCCVRNVYGSSIATPHMLHCYGQGRVSDDSFMGLLPYLFSLLSPLHHVHPQAWAELMAARHWSQRKEFAIYAAAFRSGSTPVCISWPFPATRTVDFAKSRLIQEGNLGGGCSGIHGGGVEDTHLELTKNLPCM